MDKKAICEIIDELNKTYGYSLKSQKKKITEFSKYFLYEHLSYDLENKKVYLTYIYNVANKYCNPDDELWCAVYLTEFAGFIDTGNFFFEDYFGYFHLSQRTLRLCEKFKVFLQRYAPSGSFSKQVTGAVETFVSQPDCAPNLVYSGIRKTAEESPGNSLGSHIGFVPVMKDEEKFRKMYDDYIRTLGKYSDTISEELPENKCLSSNIATQYILSARCSSSIKTLFITFDTEIIGFCVLVEYPELNYENCVFAIDQFYIIEQCRGLGIAEIVAKKIFKMYGGKGALDILTKNIPARRFWNSVFTKYAKNIKIKECRDRGKEKEIYAYTFQVYIKE